jgi:hypothetical protein
MTIPTRRKVQRLSSWLVENDITSRNVSGTAPRCDVKEPDLSVRVRRRGLPDGHVRRVQFGAATEIDDALDRQRRRSQEAVDEEFGGVHLGLESKHLHEVPNGVVASGPVSD